MRPLERLSAPIARLFRRRRELDPGHRAAASMKEGTLSLSIRTKALPAPDRQSRSLATARQCRRLWLLQPHRSSQAVRAVEGISERLDQRMRLVMAAGRRSGKEHQQHQQQWYTCSGPQQLSRRQHAVAHDKRPRLRNMADSAIAPLHRKFRS